MGLLVDIWTQMEIIPRLRNVKKHRKRERERKKEKEAKKVGKDRVRKRKRERWMRKAEEERDYLITNKML